MLLWFHYAVLCWTMQLAKNPQANEDLQQGAMDVCEHSIFP